MKKEDLNRLIIGFVSIFVYFFFHLCSGSVLKAMGVNVDGLSDKATMIISLTISLSVAIILVILNRKRLSKNFRDYKKNYKELLKRNVKYWVCSMFVMFALNAAIAIIFNRLTSANEQGIMDLFDVFPLYIVVETMILAPLSEELVFRESIRNIFKNKYLFIIISGLVFGFLHTVASLKTVADYLYIIPYSIPGFFFAYMLYKEDNVLVPVSFHIIHNTLALVFLTLAKITGTL